MGKKIDWADLVEVLEVWQSAKEKVKSKRASGMDTLAAIYEVITGDELPHAWVLPLLEVTFREEER